MAHMAHTQHLDESSAYCGSDPLLSDPMCISSGGAPRRFAPSPLGAAAFAQAGAVARGVYQGYWIYWLQCF